MYGEETVVIDVPNYPEDDDDTTSNCSEETAVIGVPNRPECEPLFRNVIFGGKRKMTSEDSTSVSAVAVLRCAAGTTGLCIYHNVYAAIPLNPNLLVSPSVSHFFVELKNDGTFSEWYKCGDAQGV